MEHTRRHSTIEDDIAKEGVLLQSLKISRQPSMECALCSSFAIRPARSSKASQRNMQHHNQALVARPSRFGSLSSLIASANRLILHELFAGVYYPKDFSCPALITIFHSAARCSLLSFMVDMVALLHVGHALKDERYLKEASRMYPVALSKLRVTLPTLADKPGVLIAIIHFLMMSELFETISPDAQHWQHHVQGLAPFYEQWGRQWVRNGAPAGAEVLFNSTRAPFALWNSLLTRKRHQGSEIIYTAILSSGNYSLAASLHYLAFRICAQLEISDHTWTSIEELQRYEAIECTQKLVDLETELHAWMTNWYSSSTAPSYTLGDILSVNSEFPLSDSTTFTKAARFTDFTSAYLHTVYWMCLLSLQETIFSLSAASTKGLYTLPFADSQQKFRTRGASECADNLCMSVAYLSRPYNGHIGLQFASLPVQLASRWFRKQGDHGKLKWCEDFAKSLNWQGLHGPGSWIV